MFLRRILIGMLAVLLSATVAANPAGFPGRAKYPDVQVIEKPELLKQLNQVIIVDARSSLEFDTLRIKGAINIPVASKTFENQVKALRATTNKPIVFYCNGRSCMKSYLAVRKAKAAKVSNAIAYDAGMFEWARSYPKYAELLGKSPVNTSDIISRSMFKKRLLDPTTFETEAFARGNKTMILDVRDKYQRGAAGFFPAQEVWASMDDQAKLQNLIEMAKKENRTLFIYDEVGKQVRWLQYALEQAKVKNYFFMDNGAKGYYANMMKDFGIRSDRMQ